MRPNVSWLSGMNRHAPVPPQLHLSRLIEFFPSAVAPGSQAALTAEAASGCVTHVSATMGRHGSSANRTTRPRSRWERNGAAAWPCAARGSVGAVGRKGRNALRRWSACGRGSGGFGSGFGSSGRCLGGSGADGVHGSCGGKGGAR